jgi:hypothetical protein
MLDTVILRLGVPEGRSLADARAEIAAFGAEPVADFNHFYRGRV